MHFTVAVQFLLFRKSLVLVLFSLVSALVLVFFLNSYCCRLYVRGKMYIKTNRFTSIILLESSKFTKSFLIFFSSQVFIFLLVS